MSKDKLEGFEPYTRRVVPTGIGKRIRIARIKADLTQADLARKIGTSMAMISSWETGRRACTNIRSIERIAKATGTHPAVLAGWIKAE